MKNKKVLISGAGIAGLTLAFFLQKNGFEPIVIEKASGLRDGGYMIDFFSSGVHVIEQMGLLDTLKERDHGSSIVRQYTDKGKKSMTLDISAFRTAQKGKLFNFLRTDLVDILYQTIKDKVEIRYNTSLKAVQEHPTGVEVTFEDGKTEQFDLLVGADGIHSNTRKLVFSEDEVEQFFLGYYVAGIEHNTPLNIKEHEVLAMTIPNKQIMTYTTDYHTEACNTSIFVLKRAEKLPMMEHQERVALLRKEFETFIQPVPEILETAAKQSKMYFDEVSQIRLKGNWYKGRTILVGDAAYCITLLSGQGASMAMTGAYLLAQKLIEFNGDPTRSYPIFEQELRPLVTSMQEKAIKNVASYLPSSRFSMWLRNLLAPILFTRPFIPFLIRQLGAVNFFEAKK
ncbi:FAD-dependent monooxygenase [Aureispira anguillae]|uniref:FAD-dependent monooxygenase n=1 Tax=Aureispira anguillae TaxID=2864201 RepID=A0A915YAR3_9BACT|nr:FAD-dependent monooxygenase [Aureispira anguillae]BDS09451.1 FAD-dependent monooxygenase [Aureispira anguillae]